MRLRSRRRQILADQRGAAAVEYAVLLLIVVGGVWVIGEAARAVFVCTERGFVAESARQAAFAVRASRASDEDAPTPPEAAARATESASTASLSEGWRFLLPAIVVLSSCPVWYELRRRRRRSQPTRTETRPIDVGNDEYLSPRIFQKRQAILRLLSNDLAATVECGVHVRHVMSRPVISVPPETSIEAVKAIVADHAIRHVLVCDGDGKLMGIISDRDLHARRGKTAADRMTPSPLTVALDTQIVPAVTAMIGRGVSALPVVHDGKCEGILTVTDVAITLQCLLQIMRKAAARLGTSSNSGGNGGADSGQ